MAFDHPERLHEAFADALRTKDAERLLDLYEPDAVTVLPDGGRVADQDARRSLVAGLISSAGEMQGTQRKFLVNGDLALTSTTYSSTVTLPDGTLTTRDSATAEVSRRQPDGTWKVVIDDPNFA